MPDYDISVPRHEILGLPESPADPCWLTILALRVEFAYIQGQVFEQLYSSAALKVNLEQRQARVESLGYQMNALDKHWSMVSSCLIRLIMCSYHSSYNAHIIQADVGSMIPEAALRQVRATRRAEATTHMSTLTLIYCSISTPSQPNDVCVASAQAALAAHKETYDMYHESEPELWQEYLTWLVQLLQFHQLKPKDLSGQSYMLLSCHTWCCSATSSTSIAPKISNV